MMLFFIRSLVVISLTMLSLSAPNNLVHAQENPTKIKYIYIHDGQEVHMVDDINAFKDLIQSTNKKILVDLYADWCEPCRKLSPYISALAHSMPSELMVVRVNVDECPSISASLSNMVLPSLLIVEKENGKPVITGGTNGIPVDFTYKNLIEWVKRPYIHFDSSGYIPSKFIRANIQGFNSLFN